MVAKIFDRQEGERGLHRRRLRQQARRRASTPTPASSSATGAPTATSRTTPTSGRYNPDAPPAQQFRTPVHCAEMSKRSAGLRLRPRRTIASRCSRPTASSSRKRGVSKSTLGDGSTWDIAFSNDPQQKFIYLADGKDEKVWILDRQSLEILTSFGDGGKMPGQFYAVHSIATDSKGNIYTTETYDGRRLQRFLYKGMQTRHRRARIRARSGRRDDYSSSSMANG
mgnify:CR=1 FL=1